MTSRLLAIVAIAVVVASMSAGCGRLSPPDAGVGPNGAPAVAPSPAAGGPANAESVRLQTLDFVGLQRLIAGHLGNVVVMDCWSTACPPCVSDFPKLVQLDREYTGKGLACISLSFDYEGIGRPEEQVPTVLDFLRKQHATLDNVLSSLDADSLYKKLDIASVPVVFVYDRQGTLVAKLQEAAEGSGEKPLYDRVEATVKRLLTDAAEANR